MRLPRTTEITAQEANCSQVPQNLGRVGCLPLTAELGVGLIEDLPGFLELSQEHELDAHEDPPARQLLVRSNVFEERFRFPGQPLGVRVLALHLPQDGFELEHPSDVHQVAGRTVGLRTSASRS